MPIVLNVLSPAGVISWRRAQDGVNHRPAQRRKHEIELRVVLDSPSASSARRCVTDLLPIHTGGAVVAAGRTR
jgi:hypothetical protein